MGWKRAETLLYVVFVTFFFFFYFLTCVKATFHLKIKYIFSLLPLVLIIHLDGELQNFGDVG